MGGGATLCQLHCSAQPCRGSQTGHSCCLLEACVAPATALWRKQQLTSECIPSSSPTQPPIHFRHFCVEKSCSRLQASMKRNSTPEL